jgi:hypothetical protein
VIEHEAGDEYDGHVRPWRAPNDALWGRFFLYWPVPCAEQIRECHVAQSGRHGSASGWPTLHRMASTTALRRPVDRCQRDWVQPVARCVLEVPFPGCPHDPGVSSWRPIECVRREARRSKRDVQRSRPQQQTVRLRITCGPFPASFPGSKDFCNLLRILCIRCQSFSEKFSGLKGTKNTLNTATSGASLSCCWTCTGYGLRRCPRATLDVVKTSPVSRRIATGSA